MYELRFRSKTAVKGFIGDIKDTQEIALRWLNNIREEDLPVRIEIVNLGGI